MARMFRDCLITEKIDGTNAQILIAELPDSEPIPAHSLGTFEIDGKLHYMAAGSRTRWITPKDDNYGFAAWVDRNFCELCKLGPGRHFGEWWGQGIQRKYGMTEKVFSLFNATRWCEHGKMPHTISQDDPRNPPKEQDIAPACCRVVPVLYRGPFDTLYVMAVLSMLRNEGSKAAPGFMDPEGIVTYHLAAQCGFKTTLKNDDKPKGQQ